MYSIWCSIVLEAFVSFSLQKETGNLGTSSEKRSETTFDKGEFENDQLNLFFFLKLKLRTLNIYIYIYIFFFFFLGGAVLGLRFCARAFSSCGKRGPLFIAVHGPLTIVASLVAEHRFQTRRLSSCGSRA